MQIIRDTDSTTASFDREELRELRRVLIRGGLDNSSEWIELLNSVVLEIPVDSHTGRTVVKAVVDPNYEEDDDEGVVR